MKKKRTREELISHGFCPFCSKCVKEVDGIQGYVLYACERCGFLSLDPSRDEHGGAYIEISPDEWQRFTGAYFARVAQAERQASQELPELLEKVLRTRIAKPSRAVN
jgi:hypothetical protein